MQNMPYIVDEITKAKIIALISALIPQAKIYLYGSRARGTNKQWSDIDIALDCGEAIARLSIGEIRDIMVASNIPYKVDVVDFYTISPEMRKAIERDKIIWKS
jgi:predicted nucleotidyltransferase